MLDVAVSPRSKHDGRSDDPRRLREILGRAAVLSARHAVASVVVGFTAREGDRMFPDFVAFVESELRVEDSVFRMTRERAVLFLSDVGRDQAEAVVQRLLAGFQRDFPALDAPSLRVRYFEVPTGVEELTVKQVLPAVFADDPGRLD